MIKIKERIEWLLLALVLLCIPFKEVFSIREDKFKDYNVSASINVNVNVNANANTPPSPFNKAATARWLAHNTEWGSLSTIQASTRERPGTPFGNISSHSDGPPSQSTGKIYFLHSPLDASMEDIRENNLVSFVISGKQAAGYCDRAREGEGETYDAEDPRCARLSLCGPLVEVNDPDEIEVAKEAMFSRHPVMKTWYTSDDTEDSHRFSFWRLELEEIWLVDFYGGAAQISIDAWDRGTDEEGQFILPSRSTMEVEFEDNATTMLSQAEVTNDRQYSQPLLPVLGRINIFFVTLLGAFILGTYIGRTTVSWKRLKRLEQGTIDPEEER